MLNRKPEKGPSLCKVLEPVKIKDKTKNETKRRKMFSRFLLFLVDFFIPGSST